MKEGLNHTLITGTATLRSAMGFICLMLMLFAGQAAMSQPMMEVQVDERRVTLSDLVHVQYTVSDAEKLTGFIPPAFAGFEIVRGPEETSGWTMDKGRMRPYVSVGFVLKPLREGSFVLDPASAVADGRKIRSGSVTVEVNDQVGKGSIGPYPAQSDQPLDEMVLKPGESVAEKIKKNLFLKLEVSRSTVFVGEPLVATYKLYTRLNSESRVVRRPSFTGFSVYEMGDREPDKSYQETVNGKVYDMYVLRRVQLYPLQDGRYELQSIEVDNVVKFLRGDIDPKGGTLDEILRSMNAGADPADAWHKEQIKLASTPQTIIVKPLPVHPDNMNFEGAVGRFTLKAALLGEPPAVGEVSGLELVVEGSGNLPLMGTPAVAWPTGIEDFEPETREELDPTQSPIRGKRVITIPFSPKDTGSYIIPPVVFSVFDPGQGRYAQVASEPVVVKVDRTGKMKNNNEVRQQAEGIMGKLPPAIYLIAAFALTLGGIILILLSWRWKKGRSIPDGEGSSNEDPGVENNLEDVGNLSLDGLSRARSHVRNGKPGDACVEIEKAVHAYLLHYYGIGRGESLERMQEMLMEKKMGGVSAMKLTEILRECQEVAFAPFSDEQRTVRLIDSTLDILKSIPADASVSAPRDGHRP
jgi:hypothetical protein